MTLCCPALLIAAPASGHGKTSVTAALARYHSLKGLRVRCFKTGPDFIDPTLLSRASGQSVYNLDTWIMGLDQCQRLLYEAALNSDLILVEGVMGLFDGTPSSADLAESFGLPILPVIDASSMAETFAALLHGLKSFRPSLNIIGAVANRIASNRHAELVQSGLAQGFPLAIMPRHAQVALPSRHLGLKLADEISDIDIKLDRLADAIGDTFLSNLPKPVPFYQPAQPLKFEPLLKGKTIAIGSDRAFCFVYAQNLALLQQLGAELVFFSPLKDNHLPKADAVYLPGGYPELYVDLLAQNEELRKDLFNHAKCNKALLAECGGMLYLADCLEDSEGVQHEMLGILPGKAIMHTKLSGIGSQQISIQGEWLRGHTFHYSSFETNLKPIAQAETPDGRSGEPFFRLGSVAASYLHLYFPSNPKAVAELFLSDS